MLFEEKTEKSLEIKRVLAELHPVTPFGQKFRNDMEPFLPGQETDLLEELQRVETIRGLVEKQRPVFVELRSAMRQIKDIRRSVERAIEGVALSPVEFFEIKNMAAIFKTIIACNKQILWKMPKDLNARPLDWLEELLDPEKSGLKTFYVYDCYSDQLACVRSDKAAVEKNLEHDRRKIITEIEEETGLSIRSNGEITVSRSNTEALDIVKSHPSFILANETYINSTYKIKPDENMLECFGKIENLKADEAVEEVAVLALLSEKTGKRGNEILANMDSVGKLDLLIAKAYHANTNKSVLPKISDKSGLVIKNGRHILVESVLRKKGREFTPVSVKLQEGVALITGANMGGKTVSLKMIGLLQGMLQYGLLVPAEKMETRLLNFIYVSSGDEQNIDQGLSTFGAEIKSINEALIKSAKPGLILIDELARGTNPHEGFAISAAIIDYLKEKPAYTVITTHFDGLVSEGIKHLQVKGLRNLDYNKLDNTSQISDFMDYTLIEIQGEVGIPRDALNISRIMGMPEEIINKAEAILAKSEVK